MNPRELELLCQTIPSNAPALADSSQPLVTVITATFNLIKGHREAFFRRCVQSVSDQNLPHLEHLIIDGGSTDGTTDLIRDCAKTSRAHVRLLSQKDHGIYDAMNRGIYLAKGKYLAFLNSDDFYHDKRGLRQSVAYLEKGNYDFSYAPIQMIAMNGKPFYHLQCSPDPSKFPTIWPFSHQSMLFLRSTMLELNGYDCTYRSAADYDYLIRAVLKGKVGVYVPLRFATFFYGGFSKDHEHLSQREVADVLAKNYHPFDAAITPTKAYQFFIKSQIPVLLYSKLSPYLQHSFPDFASRIRLTEKILKRQFHDIPTPSEIHIGFPYAFHKDYGADDAYYRAILMALSNSKASPQLVPRIHPTERIPVHHEFPQVRFSSKSTFIGFCKFVANWVLLKIFNMPFDPTLYRMDRESVDFLSHSPRLGIKTTLARLPDDLVWNLDATSLNKQIQHTLYRAPAILLDSELARQKIAEFKFVYQDCLFCLHPIAARENDLIAACDHQFPTLAKKYDLPPKFFLIPSESVSPADLDVLLEALARLQKQCPEIAFLWVSTPSDAAHQGPTLASRTRLSAHPQIRRITDLTHLEIHILMRYAVAVLYPSTQNGWSLSIEQCQSIGTPILLSDTPIHREQNPLHASFFPPHDPDALTQLLNARWNTLPAGPHLDLEAEAQTAFTQRLQAFGDQYRKILLKTHQKQAVTDPVVSLLFIENPRIHLVEFFRFLKFCLFLLTSSRKKYGLPQ